MSSQPAPGSLVIDVGGRQFIVPPGAQWLIGRSAEATIRLTDDRLSRRHAVVMPGPAGWRLVDAGSSNGMYHRGQRVSELAVDSDITVQLGDSAGVDLRLRVVPRPAVPQQDGRPTGEIGPALSGVHSLPADVVRIGRVATNDIVLNDLLVSRRHAEVRRTPAGTQIVDLNSGNGTFVNGQRVQHAILVPGSLVTIGRHSLRFDGRALTEFVDTGDVSFAATGVTVDLPGGKRILDNVSFNLGPRNLLAIVGPSGAGKSTLLGALTGFQPATHGQVLYAGRDLYANYDDLRQRIGLVPQQDILHQALTLKQALGYGAKLRFPADVSSVERAGRVTEVIGELSLTPQTDTRISAMSGGERKRASTALELLTKPSLLFLDEPTSGLDADLDRDVMNKLRHLADEGRTVVVVTHNLEHLDVCDLVMVLARGGHVAYLGPPAGALAYFSARNWADAFGRLKTLPGAEWARVFAGFAGRDRRANPPPRLPPGPPRGAVLSPIRRQSMGSQLATLCKRYLAVIAADRAYLAIIVALPFVLALFSRVVPASDGLAPAPSGVNGGARQLLLVLAVGATLMGMASAVRELVKERAIYRRERAIGLSAVAYLGSKLLVLGVVAVVQGTVLTLLAVAGRAGPESASLLGSPTLELVVAVAALSAVSAAVGLVVSAVVRDENQAMPILVLLTMAQLVLCGGLVPVAGRLGLAQLSWLVPTRWGFAAAASTTDLNAIERAQEPDSLWKHTAAIWLADYTVLTIIGIVAIAATWLLIRRLDPNRR
ncbi:MAG: FHA domain-containing protein [Mycobacteriales bacterium]